jgi:hypothetical protein
MIRDESSVLKLPDTMGLVSRFVKLGEPMSRPPGEVEVFMRISRKGFR